MRALCLALTDSTMGKAFVGLFASMTLPQWGSLAVSAFTCLYLARKTYLLRPAKAE